MPGARYGHGHAVIRVDPVELLGTHEAERRVTEVARSPSGERILTRHFRDPTTLAPAEARPCSTRAHEQIHPGSSAGADVVTSVWPSTFSHPRIAHTIAS